MEQLFVLLQAQAEGENTWLSLLPLFLILVVFYFFFIRPQTKKSKEQKKFREALKKGDKVVTIGGLHGKVADVKESTVLIEIADNTRVSVEKSAVVASPADIVQTK